MSEPVFRPLGRGEPEFWPQGALIIFHTLGGAGEPDFWPLERMSLSWYFKTFMEPRNRFQGIDSASLCSLAGRYDNPIPTRFLAPTDCLKIPALNSDFWEIWLSSKLKLGWLSLYSGLSLSLSLNSGIWGLWIASQLWIGGVSRYSRLWKGVSLNSGIWGI
jgi:hypothetical protein